MQYVARCNEVAALQDGPGLSDSLPQQHPAWTDAQSDRGVVASGFDQIDQVLPNARMDRRRLNRVLDLRQLFQRQYAGQIFACGIDSQSSFQDVDLRGTIGLTDF